MILPISVGPLGAGLIMDNLDPRYVWFAAGLSGTLSVLGFLFLHITSSKRFESINEYGTEKPAPETRDRLSVEA